MERLSADFKFSVWQKVDDNHTAVRFCTSWATKPEAVDALLAAI
jgi:threonine aldolase